jgi:hypothetical protein
MLDLQWHIVKLKLLDHEYGGRTLNRNVGIYFSITHVITQDYVLIIAAVIKANVVIVHVT